MVSYGAFWATFSPREWPNSCIHNIRMIPMMRNELCVGVCGQRLYHGGWLRNKLWKPECVLIFNMDWRITFNNIRQPMLKLNIR